MPDRYDRLAEILRLRDELVTDSQHVAAAALTTAAGAVIGIDIDAQERRAIQDESAGTAQPAAAPAPAAPAAAPDDEMPF